MLKELQGLVNMSWLELGEFIWDWILKAWGQCWGEVENIKLDKGEFIIKGTFVCTMGFNIEARTPGNQDSTLLE